LQKTESQESGLEVGFLGYPISSLSTEVESRKRGGVKEERRTEGEDFRLGRRPTSVDLRFSQSSWTSLIKGKKRKGILEGMQMKREISLWRTP